MYKCTCRIMRLLPCGLFGLCTVGGKALLLVESVLLSSLITSTILQCIMAITIVLLE